MKNLRDTKDTFTMHLLDYEMCIFAQDRPYENCDLLVEYIMDYNFDKDLVIFKSRCRAIRVAIEIVTKHADGVLMHNGVAVRKFIYITSSSTNKFSVNGRTNLKETMHTAILKHLAYVRVINAERQLLGAFKTTKVIPERSIVKG